MKLDFHLFLKDGCNSFCFVFIDRCFQSLLIAGGGEGDSSKEEEVFT